MSVMSKVVSRFDLHIAPHLPPKVAAKADWRMSNLQPWGGPLNGQTHRRRIVRDLASAITFGAAVETGTFRGGTTDFLFLLFGTPVYTVESDERYFRFAQRRFSGNSSIHTYKGDSRQFLRRLGGLSEVTARPTFFYLDAHWYKDLPLREEIDIISSNWEHAVVLVDDFQVFDDDGYGFDAYGAGLDLVLDYLPDLPDWGRYFPAARATDETGARRGSVTLASPSLRDDVSALRSLRSVPGLK